MGLEVAPYASKNLAANLVELLDQLNVDKAVFIGHDWYSFLIYLCSCLFELNVYTCMPLTFVHATQKVQRGEDPLF